MTRQPETSAVSPQRSLWERCGWWLRPALAVLLISVAYFCRLDRPLLWDDEAETGVVARNILRAGYPTASDGRNVTLYQNGAELNDRLIYKNIPWIQYYAGAVSILLFGNTTAGLRVLFALCGMASFFPIYSILKSRVKWPATAAALALLAPQVVLFQRNARYYPILILLYAVLAWHLLRSFKNPRNRIISGVVIFVLLFHTHPIAALCAGMSLIALCAGLRRDVLVAYAGAFGIGFASWVVWQKCLGASLADPDTALSLIPTNFAIWFKMFRMGVWATFVDMDAVGCLPLLAWIALAAILPFWKPEVARRLWRDPLIVFVLLDLVAQAMATAAVFGFESSTKYSMLRYESHLLVMGLVATLVVLDAAIANKALCLSACLFAVAFNFLTLSFWAKPLSRQVPASWVLPVYAEVFHPPGNAWDAALAGLRNEAGNETSSNVAMVALPRWTQNIALFYLGDHYLVRPILNHPADKCMDAMRKNLGEQAYNNLFGMPEWILDANNAYKTVSMPEGYQVVATFDSHQKEMADGSRPELTRHSFPQPEVTGTMKLYRFVKK